MRPPSPRLLLALLTLGWAVVWVQRAAISPVGPVAQEELGMDYAQLGALSTVALLAGALGYLTAGIWGAARLRGTMLLGTALLGVATLGAWASPGYGALAASLALGGFAEGLFYVPALAIVSQAAPRERLGRSLGTLDMGISVGTFAVLLATPALLLFAGWRGVFLLAGLLGLALLPLLGATVRHAPPEQAPPWRHVLRPHAWPIYAAVALLLFVYFTLVYLGPAFLVTRGFTLEEADLVAGVAIALAVPWHVLGGAWADRHGPARTAVAFGAVASLALAGLALVEGRWPTAGLLVAANVLGIGAFIGVIILVPRALGAHLAAPAFGVFWAVGYLGGAAGPLVMGAVADTAGFRGALLALALLTLAAAALLLPLRRPRPLQALPSEPAPG